MESGKVNITTAQQLDNFEDTIFDAIIKEGFHVHVMIIGHVCRGEMGMYETFSNNLHPTIKSIFIDRRVLQEMRAVDNVLRSNGHEGLDFFCPACPVGTTPYF